VSSSVHTAITALYQGNVSIAKAPTALKDALDRSDIEREATSPPTTVVGLQICLLLLLLLFRTNHRNQHLRGWSTTIPQ
jgi:hypothetical protein